jgi:hypothetical protein
MLEDLLNCDSRVDVSVEHRTDQVNAIIAHHIRNAEIPIHDFIDAVERVLFVDDSVEENSESPNILLFASIRFSS